MKLQSICLAVVLQRKFAYVIEQLHQIWSRTWWMYVSLYSLWLPHLVRWRGPVCDMYRGEGGRPLGSKVSILKVVMNGEARLYESTPLGSSSHEQANLCSSKGGFHLFHRVSVAQAWADSIWSIRIHGSVIVRKSVQIVSIVSKQTGCRSAPHSMAVMELMDSSRTEWLQETWKYICISYHLSILRWHIYLWLFLVQCKDSFMRHRQETRAVSNGHHCPQYINGYKLEGKWLFVWDFDPPCYLWRVLDGPRLLRVNYSYLGPSRSIPYYIYIYSIFFKQVMFPHK